MKQADQPAANSCSGLVPLPEVPGDESVHRCCGRCRRPDHLWCGSWPCSEPFRAVPLCVLLPVELVANFGRPSRSWTNAHNSPVSGWKASAVGWRVPEVTVVWFEQSASKRWIVALGSGSTRDCPTSRRRHKGRLTSGRSPDGGSGGPGRCRRRPSWSASPLNAGDSTYAAEIGGTDPVGSKLCVRNNAHSLSATMSF